MSEIFNKLANMSLLKPLGLLGLIGILILILIYILKPNYQQRLVSSTFVWKLSLKRKKKRLPISRFRNILVLICQVLILSLCAVILAQPVVKALAEMTEEQEKIYVIDASANMRATLQGETRFERAVAKIKADAAEVLAADGTVSVVLAGEKASFLVQRVTKTSQTLLNAALDDLVLADDLKCTYSAGDIVGAMALAEEIMVKNPDAKLTVYTATEYIDTSSARIENMAVPFGENSVIGEWNAAILGAKTELDENYYNIVVDFACYGVDTDVLLKVDVYDANDIPGNKITLSALVRCDNGDSQRHVFDTRNESTPIFSYSYMNVSLRDAVSGMSLEDSYTYDDYYFLYDGARPTIKIQYASSLPNPFVSAVLMGLRDTKRADWDIQISDLKKEDPVAMEGFDIYIFEHQMPAELPIDGVVILIDPDKAPAGSGLRVNNEIVSGDFKLAGGETHPVTELLTPENITVTKYRRIVESDGYASLWFCGGDPLFLLKNETDTKIAVLALDLNNSNLPVEWDLSILMTNLFNYFEPKTLQKPVAEVNETVSFQARGSMLRINDPTGTTTRFDNFPAEMRLIVPGTYTTTQTLLSGEESVESFYVKIAAAQSNIFPQEDFLDAPTVGKAPPPIDEDLITIFAAALVTFLFIEWWLQSREQF